MIKVWPRTSLDYIEWFGTITGLIGAVIIASNFAFAGSVGVGYCVFLLSSISYMYVAYILKRWGLFTMNVAFTIINFWGIYNWLIPLVF